MDHRHWTLDTGHWTLDTNTGHWTLVSEPWPSKILTRWGNKMEGTARDYYVEQQRQALSIERGIDVSEVHLKHHILGHKP